MRDPKAGALRWAALALALLCVLPFAFLLLLSIAHRWPFPEVWPRERDAAPWRALLLGGALAPVFLTSVALSALVAAAATAIGWLTAKHVAYYGARDRLMVLAYAPYVMSPVVLGVSILYLYLRLGLAGGFPGVVLAQTLFAASFAVVFFAPFWNREKQGFEELVRTLGGGTFDLYLRVLLPLSRGALLLCFFETFLISWFQYGLTILIGGGAVQTLPMKVYDYVNEGNPAYAALAGCLLVLPPVAMFWFHRWFQRWFQRRLPWKLV